MKSEVIVVTERDKLIEIIRNATYGENNLIIRKTHTRSFSEDIADCLLSNGVHITACATCEYIKHLKDKGMTIELMGKPLKCCPECGEKLE